MVGWLVEAWNYLQAGTTHDLLGKGWGFCFETIKHDRCHQMAMQCIFFKFLFCGGKAAELRRRKVNAPHLFILVLDPHYNERESQSLMVYSVKIKTCALIRIRMVLNQGL